MGRPKDSVAAPKKLTDHEVLEAFDRIVPQFDDGTRVYRSDLSVDHKPFFAHYVGGKPDAKNVATIRCDASFKDHPHHGKVGAVAWQITTDKRTYTAKSKSLQRFPGKSAMAEVLAAIHGMQQALKHDIEHILIMTDNQNVVHYLAETWHTDDDSYARKPRDQLESLAYCFKSVQVQWVRTKPELNAVDKLARRKMREVFARLSNAQDEYVKRITHAMNKKVTRRRVNGKTVYDGYIVATANPPQCTCTYYKRNILPALTRNPKNRPKAMCRHLAAAFKDAGHTAHEMADHLRAYHTAKKLGEEPPTLGASPHPPSPHPPKRNQDA